MRNLIIFSSLFFNKKIIDHLINTSNMEKISYIPAQTDFGNFEDTYLSRQYKQVGFKNVDRFDIGYFYDEKKEEELFASDVIHLGGGNTFLLNFLLKKNGMDKKIKKYVENGGILIGNSAGGIVMSDTARIATIADEDIIKSGDDTSLGLVNFEVKPHFEQWIKYLEFFKEYSEFYKKDLYCLNENQAIIIKDDRIIPVNKPLIIKAI